MGVAFSCVSKVSTQIPAHQPTYYRTPRQDVNVDNPNLDMTPLRNRNLPIIWVSGQQNTGKKTHANLIKEKFDYEHISVSELLRHEAAKESDRALVIRDAVNLKKKISDVRLLQFTLSILCSVLQTPRLSP